MGTGVHLRWLKSMGRSRLISWLSCKLPPHVDGLIQEVMLEFAQLEPVHSDRILRIGEFHLGKKTGANQLCC